MSTRSPSAERRHRLEQLPWRDSAPATGVLKGFTSQVTGVWEHRELLGRLIRRELKARYKDSSLGFVWSLLRPLTMLLIYYVVLGEFLGAARAIPDFAIYVFSGLTAWGLFVEAVTAGTGSIVGNAGLIKKVKLPREIFPLATLGSAVFNFAVQLVILVAATIAAGAVPSGSRWAYLPLSLAVIVLTALGWSLLLSAVNVYLRDVQHLVEIATMVFFWASPIAYSWALVSGHLRHPALEALYLSNPMTVAIMGFQQTFWVAGTDQPFPPHLEVRLMCWIVVGTVFTFLAQRAFARMQGNFAQEL